LVIGPLVLLLSVVTVPGDRVTTSQSPIANGVRAAIDSGRYDQAEATARLLVANTGAAYGAESPQAAVASDLLVEALLRNGRDPDVIRVQAERTLRIRERRLGTQHAELVPTLLNLGEVLIEDGEYPRASTVIERAVVLEEKQSGPSSVPVARALDTLGLAHMHGGAYDLALRALDRSLRIKEARLAAGDVEIARTLAATGWTLQRSGAYDRAGPLIRRALAIQEAADVSHPAYVGLLNVLGLQLWFEGDLASARVTAERAVAAAERTLRPGHPDLARSLNNAAVAAADLGDVEWARSAQERALRIAEANYGATNYHVAGYVSDLASLNLLAGTYLSARALFERSLSFRLK
jgi:tetratricopeptide (TPR) repeat protein